MSKLRPANAVLSLVSKLPKQPDFLARKRLLLASQEVSICPDVGLCANGTPSDNAFVNGTQRLQFKAQAKRLNKSVGFRAGGVMHEIENLQDSAEHCFELASAQNFLEEDVASEAFELLTANEYDGVLAHGLGVSL